MNKLKINKNLLPVKGYYFLWNGGAFTMLSFIPVYAKQLGYSSFVLGIVCAVLPLSGMLGKPLMGMVADKYNCQKIIFLTAQLVAAIAFLNMIFLPEVPTTANIRFRCENSEVALESFESACEVAQSKGGLFDNEVLCNMTCPLEPQDREIVCNYWKDKKNCSSYTKNLSFTAHISTNITDQNNNCIYFVKNVTLEHGDTRYPNCSGRYKISTNCDIKCDTTNNFLVKSTTNDKQIASQYKFWLFLFAYLIAWTSQAVTTSIGDAVCFQILGKQPHKYGYQRMWGALGCGILSIISGFLVDAFSESETKKNYNPVFLTGTGILVACFIVSLKIQYTQQQISENILKNIGCLLATFRIWIFMLFCMCVGLCTALTWYFLFWHLEDLAANYGYDMQSNMKTIEGLILGIQCLGGDLPFLFLSSWILKQIGHVHTMSFILLVIGVKFVLYSFLTNPWWCLPIEFLNGPTFGLFYATMTSYASIVAPPGTEATTQGLVGAIFEGIGLSLGSLMGGLLFQEFGGSIAFRIFGISTLVVCFLHVGVQYLIRSVAVPDKSEAS